MSRSTNSAGQVSNELNLAPFIHALLRRWWIILAATLLGALAAFVYTKTLPVSFRAESALAIMRVGTTVNLDGRVRTVSDNDPAQQSIDQLSRRVLLQTVGKSQDVGAIMIRELGGQLPAAYTSPAEVTAAASVTEDGDVIRIQATTASSDSAVLIANAYARAYAEYINGLFSAAPVDLETLQTQVAEAKQNYNKQQAALQTRIASAETEPLRRQVDLLSGQLDAQVKLELKLNRLEQDALALRARWDKNADGKTPGLQLAQLMMEANAFNNTFDFAQGLPSTFLDSAALDVAALTPAQQVASLDDLLLAIQQRREALSAEKKQALYQQLAETQAKYETAQAELKELQAARDLAWNTYQLLATKESEAKVSAGYPNQVVRVVSTARNASETVAARLTLNVLMGAMIGAMVGIALALVLEWLPFGKKRNLPQDKVMAASDATPGSH